MKKYIIEWLGGLVNLRSNFTINWRLNILYRFFQKKSIPTELL